MPIISGSEITPRESIEHEWYVEEQKRSYEHAVRMKQLEIAFKKQELQLRQMEAVKARKHHEAMKELEYAIRYQETRWRSLFRIPLMILKLPIYIILGIGAMILLIRKQEIPKEIYELLK